MENERELRISGNAFEWRLKSHESENLSEITLSRNLYFVAHYLRSNPATIKVLQEGIKIMLQEIADYFGLTIEELYGIKP